MSTDCIITVEGDYNLINKKWYAFPKHKPKPFVSVLVYMPDEAPLPTVHEGYMSDTGIWWVYGYFRADSEISHWSDMPQFNPATDEETHDGHV